MKSLTVSQIIHLHELLIKETGGAAGIRDGGLLDSAVAAPFQSFDGVSLYPTIEKKAARLAFGLICSHPFTDGNKRIGILAMLTLLELNGIYLRCADPELVALGLGIADHSIPADKITEWILDRS